MRVANIPNAKPVKFTAAVDDAIKEAKKKKMPFLIFFCSADVASTSGENEAAYEAYRQCHKGQAPHWTVFDCPQCTDLMRKKGVSALVKVANTDANKELYKQYGAHENMLAICMPDGTSVLATSGDNHNGLVSLLDEYEDSKNGINRKK